MYHKPPEHAFLGRYFLSKHIRTFYQAVQIYYPAEALVEQALVVIETGVIFLRAAKLWWSETSGL